MLHGPAAPQRPDHASGTKMRIGVWMFIVYAIIYAGFVVVNLTNPLLMEEEVIFGLNLAVFYGFGLIVFALVLALIYNKLCAKHEAQAERAHAAKTEEGK